MKTFSVAVAVAVMLAFICTQESSALPLTGLEELEQPVNNNNGDLPDADHPLSRVKRGKIPGGPICFPYCYPTGDGVECGVRCIFQ
ncbi:hepcidin-like isoform X3 [Plectropomus leopardus]|uniref:hepcidin-like isoform X3 n=1 Tax=Plectropomus leopardus TaxID=160734 RepID=UPI001C4B52E2|nr:hepcidin-like isoform X3 [Plectropomus leopardus]